MGWSVRESAKKKLRVLADLADKYSLNSTKESGHLTDKATHRCSNQLMDFELKDKLGSGSFGDVYEAYKPSEDKYFALKMCNIVNEKLYRSLHYELKVMIKIQHINLVPLECASLKYGILVLAMPSYVSLDPLVFAIRTIAFRKQDGSSRHLNNPSLSNECLRQITYQLTAGLAYLHSCSILHRDLKCGNILVDKDGTVKIADFGLSKIFNAEDPNSNPKTPCGTSSYLAPEVGKVSNYGITADTWSLGITLLELIFAERPFTQANKEARSSILLNLYENRNTEVLKIPVIYPKNGNQIEKKLSDGLRSFLTACMDPNPETRLTCQRLLNEHELFEQFQPWQEIIKKELLNPKVKSVASAIQHMRNVKSEWPADPTAELYPAGSKILFALVTRSQLDGQLHILQINADIRYYSANRREFERKLGLELLNWVYAQLITTDDFVQLLSVSANLYTEWTLAARLDNELPFSDITVQLSFAKEETRLNGHCLAATTVRYADEKQIRLLDKNGYDTLELVRLFLRPLPTKNSTN